MNIKNQRHEKNYSIYNADNMSVLPAMESESVDLSIYSLPFCGLFQYSSDPRDMSNCASHEEFLTQYEFMVEQMARVTKKGRINAVHCMDICDSYGYLWDFPHEIIEVHKRHGMSYRNRITVWKEPLKVRMRTMVQSLMHKFIVEDSTKCFPATPDYILIFTKNGEAETKVTHEHGIEKYCGANLILPHMVQAYNNANNTDFDADGLRKHLESEYDGTKTTKLNHYIWQRYASSVWDDIRIDNVLPFRDSKEDDDEKHIHPLQLDVIERIVELYSNPDEVVLTPFMGVGSEVYGAVKNGRKGVGIELKTSYYKQAERNMDALIQEMRENKPQQIHIDDLLEV
jgi:DNA modification methylase